MNLVTIADGSLHLGGKLIFQQLHQRIDQGERIGLIGPNGSGKTTLLRLLAGAMQLDGGTLSRAKGLRIGYLPQTMEVLGGQSVLAFMRGSVPQRTALETRLQEVQAALEGIGSPGAPALSDDELMQLAGEIGELHETLADFDRRYSDFHARRMLCGLGFAESDEARDIGELSGGWKMRAVLASLLFQAPDLLLLDEPTNHLDMPSVAWLSGFLARYSHAFVLISHDREFLNEHIRRVISFEPEGVRTYPGDYDQYERLRADEALLLEQQAGNIQKERERLQEFISRFRAKASKASAVQSRVRALEKMGTVQTLGQHRRARFRFPPAARAGRDVLRANGLQHHYGERQVLRDVEAYVERGQKICLLGANGAGKTTLLRLLAGEVPLQTGEVHYGHGIKLGYYAQHHGDILRADATVYDAVAEKVLDGGVTQIRAALGAMLFGEDDIHKTIGVLSGGERARVALARLLVDPGNFLLMDEPTNHLDLASTEALAEALAGFDGTLLFVSHNRGLIRRLATQIWSAEAGGVHVYPGTFDEFMESSRRRLELSEEKPASKNGNGQSTPPPQTKQRKSARPLRAPAPKDEIARLEQEIGILEESQRQRAEQLSQSEIYQDAAKHRELTQRYQRDAAELESKMGRWTALQEQVAAS